MKVVFGHMHKELAYGNGLRKMIVVGASIWKCFAVCSLWKFWVPSVVVGKESKKKDKARTGNIVLVPN